jgi:uracil-DNA glycosylase family 4
MSAMVQHKNMELPNGHLVSVSNEALLKCRRCPALRRQFKGLRQRYPDYWNKPVPAVVLTGADILIIGLAPGLHGANRTGIPFEGDASSKFLRSVLEQLDLIEKVSITNVLKCLPEQNKPKTDELKRCERFFLPEIEAFKARPRGVLLALGRVAHERIIRALGLRQKDYPFVHARAHQLDTAHWLVDSYHSSRYNTQTGRLTEAMLITAVDTAARLVK